MDISIAYVMMFFVAILAATTSIFTKKALISLHAAQFNAGRGVMDAIFLIVLAPVLFSWIGWQGVGLTAFVALFGSIASVLVVKGMRHQGISEVTPLFNLSPLFLVVLAYFFLGERLTTVQFIGIAVLIVGAYILQADKHDFFKPFKKIKNKYVIFTLIALFIYSCTAIMEKSFLGIIVEPLAYLWWIRLFLTFGYFGYDFYMYGTKELKGVVQKKWKELSIVSGLGWVGLGLLYMAIPLAPISIIIPIKRTSTLFSTIFGGKFFKEGHLPQRIGACVIMLLGAILIITV